MDPIVISNGCKVYRKSTHSIEEVLDLVPEWDGIVKERRIVFHGDELYIDSLRYFTFKKDNCTCVKCGLKGAFFAKEKHLRDNRYHLNLYAFDEDGNEVLMTKDHRYPKAKGGSNDISNLDTMCAPCNHAKGNTLPNVDTTETES